MKILFLLVSSIVFSQSKDNCVKESIVQNDYYIDANYLIKGYTHGSIDFDIEVDYVNSNSNEIVLFVFEKNGMHDKKPLKGVNFDKICAINDKLEKFKIKKNISISDEKGKLILNLNIKRTKFISINYPGYKPIIIDFKKIKYCNE